MRGWRVLMTGVVLALVLTVPVRQTGALGIDSINIFQGTDRVNGAVQDYFFEIEVHGTGIANAVFVCVDTGKWGALTDQGGGLWDNSQSFGSMAGLLAAHPADPTTQYRLYFNKQVSNPKPDNFAHWEDLVYLGFSATAPSGFATITYPTHLATGVALNPNYTWNSVVTFGTGLGRWVCDPGTGNDVYGVDYDNNMALMSWQPGGLTGNKTYEIEVSVAKYVGKKPLNLTMLSGDPFVYSGAFEDINLNEFTTVPEPLTTALVGTGVLALVGLRRRRRMK